MARVDTAKDINPTQLCVELGRVELRHVAGSYVEASVDQAVLDAAVAAHVADPAYVDPTAPAFPPLPPTGVLALTLFLGGKLASPAEAVACCGFPVEHLNHEANAWLAYLGGA